MRSHENGISKLGYNTTTEVTARPRAVPTASPHETCGGPIRPLERPARTHAHRIVSSHKAASRRGTAHQHDTQHACTQFESKKQCVVVRFSLGQKRSSFAKTGSGRPATNCRKETARRRRRRRNKRRRRRQKIARGDPPRDEEIQGRACRQKRPSFNFSCGLSRACLGKYSVCSIKWHRNKRRAEHR